MNRKYIVIKPGSGEEIIFTFPPEVRHSHMLEQVVGLKYGGEKSLDRPYMSAKCVAAGFIIDGKCYGRSESIGVESRNAIDTALLANEAHS